MVRTPPPTSTSAPPADSRASASTSAGWAERKWKTVPFGISIEGRGALLVSTYTG